MGLATVAMSTYGVTTIVKKRCLRAARSKDSGKLRAGRRTMVLKSVRDYHFHRLDRTIITIAPYLTVLFDQSQ